MIKSTLNKTDQTTKRGIVLVDDNGNLGELFKGVVMKLVL